MKYYPKLRGRIREIFGTQDAFAKAMNLGASCISLKLAGKVDWSLSEIEKACSVLGIDESVAHEYFFSGKFGNP